MEILWSRLDSDPLWWVYVQATWCSPLVWGDKQPVATVKINDREIQTFREFYWTEGIPSIGIFFSSFYINPWVVHITRTCFLFCCDLPVDSTYAAWVVANSVLTGTWYSLVTVTGRISSIKSKFKYYTHAWTQPMYLHRVYSTSWARRPRRAVFGHLRISGHLLRSKTSHSWANSTFVKNLPTKLSTKEQKNTSLRSHPIKMVTSDQWNADEMRCTDNLLNEWGCIWMLCTLARWSFTETRLR